MLCIDRWIKAPPVNTQPNIAFVRNHPWRVSPEFPGAPSGKFIIWARQRNPVSMNIGVLGYYGFGNAGDEMILKNLERILAPNRVIPVAMGLLAGPDTIRRLNQFDFLILGGGGLYLQTPRPSASVLPR